MITIPQLWTVLGEAFQGEVPGKRWWFHSSSAWPTASAARRSESPSVTSVFADLRHRGGPLNILGTLMSPLIKHRFGDFLSELFWHGQWTEPLFDKQALTEIVTKNGFDLVMSGVVVGAIGIGICGIAGRLKEKQLKSEAAPTEFSITKGLLLSLLAGVLSAVYNFSIDPGVDRRSGRRSRRRHLERQYPLYLLQHRGFSSPRRSTACISTPNTARSASLSNCPPVRKRTNCL